MSMILCLKECLCSGARLICVALPDGALSIVVSMSDELYFFFFQAEDGIRDYKVTGVQTCALPICRHARPRAAAPPVRSPRPHRTRSLSCAHPPPERGRKCRVDERQELGEAGRAAGSEERRGGEEGRSRWAPDP